MWNERDLNSELNSERHYRNERHVSNEVDDLHVQITALRSRVDDLQEAYKLAMDLVRLVPRKQLETVALTWKTTDRDRFPNTYDLVQAIQSASAAG